MRTLSERFALLSFFEDRKIRYGTEEKVEWPVWRGSISVDTNAIGEERIYRADVIGTTFHALWDCEVVHDWGSHISLSSTTFNEIPPVSYTLPPFVRLRGDSSEDNKTLFNIADVLNASGKIITLDNSLEKARFRCHAVWIMSRKQLLNRFHSYDRLRFRSPRGDLEIRNIHTFLMEDDTLFAFLRWSCSHDSYDSSNFVRDLFRLLKRG